MQLAIIKNSGGVQFAKIKLIRGSRFIVIPDVMSVEIPEGAVRYRVC